VFCIPKRLRIYFLFDRKLLAKLSICAWKVVKTYLTSAAPDDSAVHGASIAVQTYGEHEHQIHGHQKEGDPIGAAEEDLVEFIRNGVGYLAGFFNRVFGHPVDKSITCRGDENLGVILQLVLYTFLQLFRFSLRLSPNQCSDLLVFPKQLQGQPVGFIFFAVSHLLYMRQQLSHGFLNFNRIRDVCR
jgi:hypothetical protein